jgi:hypothetical protein
MNASSAFREAVRLIEFGAIEFADEAVQVPLVPVDGKVVSITPGLFIFGLSEEPSARQQSEQPEGPSLDPPSFA